MIVVTQTGDPISEVVERDGFCIVDERSSGDVEGGKKAAGVIFIAQNGEGPGVRLKKQHEGGG